MALVLEGVGLASAWETDASGAVTALDRRYVEDDFRTDPDLGLAIVARGAGANRAQGRPAAVLATWSVVGELRASGLPPAEALARGFNRANEAVARLTWAWGDARRPTTTAAAMLLDGDQAILAHVGNCRICRITPAGLVDVTADHALAELPDVVTRALGTDAAAAEVQRLDVREGDEFLLATRGLLRIVPAKVLAAICTPALPPEQRVFEVHGRARAQASSGSAAVAIVRVEGRRTGLRALGGSMRPEPSWLFAPGGPLPSPPPGLEQEAAPAGPDARWFELVAEPLSRL